VTGTNGGSANNGFAPRATSSATSATVYQFGDVSDQAVTAFLEKVGTGEPEQVTPILLSSPRAVLSRGSFRSSAGEKRPWTRVRPSAWLLPLRGTAHGCLGKEECSR